MAQTQNIKEIVSSVTNTAYRCINQLINGQDASAVEVSVQMPAVSTQKVADVSNINKIEFPAVVLIMYEKFITEWQWLTLFLVGD